MNFAEFKKKMNESKKTPRVFNPVQKLKQYNEQKGICKKCNKHFEMEEMEADHIKPWEDVKKTIPSNCQMLCKKCHRIKTNEQLRK